MQNKLIIEIIDVEIYVYIEFTIKIKHYNFQKYIEPPNTLFH